MAKAIPVKLDPPLLARIKLMAQRMGEAESVVMRVTMRLGLQDLEKLFEKDPAGLARAIAGAAYPEHEASSLALNEDKLALELRDQEINSLGTPSAPVDTSKSPATAELGTPASSEAPPPGPQSAQTKRAGHTSSRKRTAHVRKP